MPEGEEEDQEIENLFEKIMKENISDTFCVKIKSKLLVSLRGFISIPYPHVYTHSELPNSSSE